jgi:hypothetical protein
VRDSHNRAQLSSHLIKLLNLDSCIMEGPIQLIQYEEAGEHETIFVDLVANEFLVFNSKCKRFSHILICSI